VRAYRRDSAPKGQSVIRLTQRIRDVQLPHIFSEGHHMNLHLALTPIISLIAGILILIMPKLLNFIVAIYLIAVGLIGLFGGGSMRL
jgi:hypothetical protein